MADDPYAALGTIVAATKAGAEDPYAAIGEAAPSVDAATVDAPAPATATDAPEGWQVGTAPQPDGSERRFAINPNGKDVLWLADKPETASHKIVRGLGAGTRDIIGGAGEVANLATSPIRAAMSATGLGDVDYERLADRFADWLGLAKTGDVQSATQRGIISGLLTAGIASPAAAGEGVSGLVAKALATAPVTNSVAAGVASGAGEIAKENGASPLEQTAIGLAAASPVSVAGVASPAIADAAYHYASRLAQGFTHEGALAQAAATLRRQLSGNAGNAIDAIENAPKPVAGVTPTLAERAQDVGLAGLQRGWSNVDPGARAALAEREQSNALARTRAASETMGDGSPQVIQDQAQREMAGAEAATAKQQTELQVSADERLASERDRATKERQRAELAVVQARTAIGSEVDRDATGASARDSFDQAYDAAKKRTSAAYNDPHLTTPVPIDIPRDYFEGLRAAADNFYGDGGGAMPTDLRQIVDDAAAEGATTRTLTNIDRRLADFSGRARMSGNRSDAAFSDRLRVGLSDVAQEVATPEYRAALANAKSVRAEQGRLFETGNAATAFLRDRYGAPLTGDNSVADKLVRPGSPGGDTAEGLVAAIGTAPAENIVRQHIRRLADEGSIDTEAKARTFATRFGEVARRFPGVRSDLDELRQRAAELDSAKQAERDAHTAGLTLEEKQGVSERSALHDALLKTPLARAADASRDPSSFVSELLRKQDNGRALKALYGQIQHAPEAVSGFRRSLGDFIEAEGKTPNFTAAGDQVPGVRGTQKAIATVLDRAGNILTTEQRMVLKSVQRELQSMNFALTAGKPPGSETMLNKSFADVMNAVPIPGLVGKTKMLLGKALATLGNGNEVRRLITQAILDPDFAATLLKRPTPRHWLQVQHGMLGRRVSASAILLGRPLYGGVHPSLSQVAPYLETPALAAQDQQQNQKR